MCLVLGVFCARLKKIRGYICIKNKVGGGMEGQGRRGLRKEGVGAIPLFYGTHNGIGVVVGDHRFAAVAGMVQRHVAGERVWDEELPTLELDLLGLFDHAAHRRSVLDAGGRKEHPDGLVLRHQVVNVGNDIGRGRRVVLHGDQALGKP